MKTKKCRHRTPSCTSTESIDVSSHGISQNSTESDISTVTTQEASSLGGCEYKCDQCKKEFARKQGLTRHQTFNCKKGKNENYKESVMNGKAQRRSGTDLDKNIPEEPQPLQDGPEVQVLQQPSIDCQELEFTPPPSQLQPDVSSGLLNDLSKLNTQENLNQFFEEVDTVCINIKY